MLIHEQKNREREFEELFISSYRIFFAIGYQLTRDKAFTKDVIQSFFVELWGKSIWEKEIKHPLAYLRKAFYRKVLNEIALDQKRAEELAKLNPLPAEASYESWIIEQEEQFALQENLQKAITQLPEKQQEMLKLRFQQGMEYDEIASSTGKSRQTIYNQIHEAVKKLRSMLL